MQKFHWAGAFFTFVGGNVWMVVQSFVSKKVRKDVICLKICKSNFSLSLFPDAPLFQADCSAFPSLLPELLSDRDWSRPGRHSGLEV